MNRSEPHTNVYAYIQPPTSNGDAHHTERYSILAFAASSGIGQVNVYHESVHDQLICEKPVLSGMIANLTKNSVFIVAGFSRLGSSTGEVLEALAKLSERGVMVYIIDSGFRLDNNSQAQVVATACSLVTQIEHALASNRATVALAQDNTAGHPVAIPAPRTRRSILDAKEDQIRSLLADSVPLAEIGRILGGVNRQTLKDFVSRKLSR